MAVILSVRSYSDDREYHSGDGGYYSHVTAKPGQPVSFSALVQAIDSGKWDIESVLETLPLDYRSNYVLAYDSRSLQRATPLSPRAILHGIDGKLIIAFNGDPSLPGYQNLEIIEFNDTTRKFEFHEIQFSPDGKTKPQVVVHPTNCTLCHGEPSRPRWDVYSSWGGMYGSEDDHATFSFGAGVDPTNDGKELHDFKEFQNKRARERQEKKGRYRFLEEPTPFYERAVRPNAKFSVLLSHMNKQNIATGIKEDVSLYNLRYLMEAVFAPSCDFAGFFPPDMRRDISETLDALGLNVHRVNRAANAAKAHRLDSLLGTKAHATEYRSSPKQEYADYMESKIADFRFIIEGLGNGTVIDWGMEFQPRSYNFDQENEFSALEGPLTAYLFSTPEDRALLSQYSSTPDFCGKLRERHQAAFPWDAQNRARLRAALNKLKNLKSPDSAAPFGKCVSCHQAGNPGGARSIPFSDRAELIRTLSYDSKLKREIRLRIGDVVPSGKSSMPPSQKLEESERQAIQQFLDRI